MTGVTELTNGRVVTPDGVVEGGRLALSGSRIDRVDASGSSASATRTVDVGGRVVMPGLVDLHGDDIEQQRYPRSNARVSTRTALAATDRTNLLAGVTTKFHAVAFEETPSENRTLADAAALCRAIADAEYTLCDNRIHARCELLEESVAAVEEVLETVDVDLVSVMHHAPGDGQFDEAGFRRHYGGDRGASTDGVEQLAAERTRSSESSREGLAARIAAAADAGTPLASHDDASPVDVDRMADAGATISEFPVTKAAAERATDRQMVTTMGAPNLVRGGSLWDNLRARSAIDAGLLDVLCSDYHPPSLLEAPFVDTGESLSDRVARVTAAPAAAVGLSDRGRLEAGYRGDVLVVDPDPVPTVSRVFVAGREVLRSGVAGRQRRLPS